MENEGSNDGLQSALATLEAKRDEIEQAIKVVRGLIGQPAPTDGAGHHKGQIGNTLTPTLFFSMGVGEAAKKYLSIVKEPKSAPAIAAALQAHGIQTVSKNFNATVFPALDRCFENDELVRPKRGLWGLSEWYPGRRRGRDNGEKKESAKAPSKPSQGKSPSETKEANRVAVGIAGNAGVITVGALEQFVREKARRVKDVEAHFGVTKEAVKQLLEPNSKVYIAGIGWLKVRE
jgi:hypothetical protein